MSKEILIYKFGGASVKNADGFRNVQQIISNKPDGKNLLVVISALGKTTNALEQVVEAYFAKSNALELLNKVKADHEKILDDLFNNKAEQIYSDLNNVFVEVEWILEEEPMSNYDYIYDQIVSAGEMASSKILAAFCRHQNLKTKWCDVRELILTDETWREAKVDWNKTEKQIQKLIAPEIESSVLITQGFVGGTAHNQNTTLGREGSDYSAAIFAYCLNAAAMYIWKDVDGVLNADPRYFSNATKIESLSYYEAIEMTFYGATVIHPKTIKPLQNKNIPLYVKSFLHPQQSGTCVFNSEEPAHTPVLVLKPKQLLLSLSAKDFSFIAEENLSHIFHLFSKHRVKMNLMQNSAVSFSVCLDFDEEKTSALLDELHHAYKLFHNDDVELLTIRHYEQKLIDEQTANRKVLLEQKTRHTIQLVLEKKKTD